MGARAEAVEETRLRILTALVDLAGERPFADITLEVVAERAGTTVQTVLRRFGSKDALFADAMELAMGETERERRTPTGDVATAVRVVVDHYETRGRTALLMLAQETHDPFARAATDRGKAMHRAWAREAFAPVLAGLDPDLADDDGVLDLLVVATDVYTWKLLRIDRGLSRATVERRMRHLVDAVLASARKEP